MTVSKQSQDGTSLEIHGVPSCLCLETVIKNLHETYECRMYSKELLMMGQGGCPKHVEFYNNKIWIIIGSGWLFKKKSITMHGNIIKRHIDNRESLLICILLLSHSLIFFRFIFYQYMVVFLFNTVIYVFLL